MKFDMKIIIKTFIAFVLMLCVCFGIIALFSEANAAVKPKSAGYDERIQKVSYNAYNTTEIYAKIGFLTTLMFDLDEMVLDARSGYDKGWDINFDKNTIFIMPRPVLQEYTYDSEVDTTLYPPISTEWNTNLFVVTSKRYYSMILNSIDDTDNTKPAFIVNYTYPDQVTKQVEQAKLAIEADKEKAKISEELEKAAAPKNWNYFMQVGKNSDRIKPDFAYDNGVFTYIGFRNTQLFPSSFLYINGKEQLTNFSVQRKGKYQILVIHSVNDRFVLRYDDQVIGITNQSFGQLVVPNYSNTLSQNVQRVEK